jgi:hypothetical protein
MFGALSLQYFLNMPLSFPAVIKAPFSDFNNNGFQNSVCALLCFYVLHLFGGILLVLLSLNEH